MNKALLSCIAGCLFSVVCSQAHASCENLTGDYTYSGGKGVTKVLQINKFVTMISRWENNGEYLFRATRNGNQLTGDWALIRDIGGANVANPVFRKYVGQINLDCSIVGTGSDDPGRANIDGMVNTPAR